MHEAHGLCEGCEWGSSRVRILVISSRSQSFFCLETPRNLKWIFFTLYCLQKPYKNHWSSFFIPLILHVMSWFVDLHDFSPHNTQNTYWVAWFRIKVNYNDSSETIQYIPQTIDKSSKSHVICLQMQTKVLKT